MPAEQQVGHHRQDAHAQIGMSVLVFHFTPQHARAEDCRRACLVGLAAKPGMFGRIVFGIGILDDHVGAGHGRNPGANRHPLAHVAFMQDDAHFRHVDLLQDLPGPVSRVIVDDQDFARPARRQDHGIRPFDDVTDRCSLVITANDDGELFHIRGHGQISDLPGRHHGVPIITSERIGRTSPAYSRDAACPSPDRRPQRSLRASPGPRPPDR